METKWWKEIPCWFGLHGWWTWEQMRAACTVGMDTRPRCKRCRRLKTAAHWWQVRWWVQRCALMLAGVLLPLTGCARIAGEVTVQGRPAEGVVLLIGEFSTTTNSAGDYSVWVQRPWSGTVAIPRYGPQAKIVYENVTEDRLGQHWHIRLRFKEISGWVMDGTVTPEAPLAGVTMEIRGQAGNGDAYARDVVTDENGVYVAPVPIGYEITIQNYAPPASQVSAVRERSQV